MPSRAPLLGAPINVLRRLTQPVVKLFVGGHLARQQEFNAHVVRHLNELGQRLEERARGLEQALEVWSADPSGIEMRLRRTLDHYDAALRQRHMTLFSALEEEVLVAHTAAQRVQKLEELVVERRRPSMFASTRRIGEARVLSDALTETQSNGKRR